ncbi:hypothetical protein G7Z17_g6804 [Cylindrodendrum hubeiense]|uniref:Ankyrin repeat protein n=1 Tax=Cylindrodendrum hubeiense TaxID=595255 RepID=A0A9P5LET1_9HYPO|nr:hypothetical protein G7Z17_g6804 [Cylindrodendrum hubeiense]
MAEGTHQTEGSNDEKLEPSERASPPRSIETNQPIVQDAPSPNNTTKPIAKERKKPHVGSSAPNATKRRSLTLPRRDSIGKEEKTKKRSKNEPSALSKVTDRLRPDQKGKGKSENVAEIDIVVDDVQNKLRDSIVRAMANGDSVALNLIIQLNPGSAEGKYGERQEPLLLLAIRNTPDNHLIAILDIVLTANPKLDVQDISERTPLMSASGRGSMEAVKILLSRGANVDAQDKKKETALYNAVVKGRTKVVKELLKLKKGGANPNIANNRGRTPLHSAASRGYHIILENLLFMDDINVSPKDIQFGYTPLHHACSKDHRDVVKTLLEYGAEVNARSMKNWTPLHIAAKRGNAEIVEELLQAGADANLFTQTLDTPESLVPKNDDKGVIELLKRKHSAKDNATNKGGKDLNISKPNPDQEEVCQEHQGFIWPSVDHDYYRYDTLSVWDMLYSQDPRVKKLRGSKTTRWIHLPANNRTWLEVTNHQVYRWTETPKAHFEANFRQPHDICGNMQQPYYYFLASESDEESGNEDEPNEVPDSASGYTDVSGVEIVYSEDATEGSSSESDPDDSEDESKNAKERRIVKQYTRNEGRPLNEDEQNHVHRMWELKKTYDIHLSRSLDESFYELLPAEDINNLNADQVLSRYIARFRYQVESDPEESDQSYQSTEYGDESEYNEPSGLKKGAKAVWDSIRTRFQVHDDEDLKERSSFQVSDRVCGSETVRERPESPTNSLTPSQLENQGTTNRGRTRRWLSNIVSPFKKRNHGDESSDESAAGESDYESDIGSVPGDDDEDGISKARPRQQLLIVPQLWILKVEITTFPERWDSSNPRVLPKIMLSEVEERNKNAKKNEKEMDVNAVLDRILESCLAFKPYFSAYNEERSYHDAFAAEIAHVSSRVTASYRNYRKSLGKTEESFALAMKEETELLILVDDILSEIAMVKRVHEDQSQVCISMKTEHEQDVIKHNEMRGSHRRPQTSQNDQFNEFQHGHGSFQDNNMTRPLLTRHPDAKLLRQEEDAKRVREAIITLLDLRQRQASTESAINSGQQSKMLFEQSKVLFVFTGATVLFAPLSWVSSLLAVKIENFTPDVWRQGQAIGASFGSLLGTLLLCLAFWRLYDHYYTDTGESKIKRR